MEWVQAEQGVAAQAGDSEAVLSERNSANMTVEQLEQRLKQTEVVEKHELCAPLLQHKDMIAKHQSTLLER